MTWTKTHNWNNKNVPIGTSTKPKPLLELKLKITKMIIKIKQFSNTKHYNTNPGLEIHTTYFLFAYVNGK